MTDEDLIGRTAAGDDAAFAELACRYRSLLRLHRAIGLFAPGLDDGDFEQIARIALWRAARSWQPGRMSFPGYAKLVVRRDLVDALQSALCSRHQPLGEAHELGEAADLRSDPARLAAGGETLAEVRAALPLLSRREARATLAVGIGVAYDELGEPPRQVDNCVQRGRRKLREALAA